MNHAVSTLNPNSECRAYTPYVASSETGLQYSRNAPTRISTRLFHASGIKLCIIVVLPNCISSSIFKTPEGRVESQPDRATTSQTYFCAAPLKCLCPSALGIELCISPPMPSARSLSQRTIPHALQPLIQNHTAGRPSTAPKKSTLHRPHVPLLRRMAVLRRWRLPLSPSPKSVQTTSRNNRVCAAIPLLSLSLSPSQKVYKHHQEHTKKPSWWLE